MRIELLAVSKVNTVHHLNYDYHYDEFLRIVPKLKTSPQLGSITILNVTQKQTGLNAQDTY